MATVGLNVSRPTVCHRRPDQQPRRISLLVGATVWLVSPPNLRAALSMFIMRWLGRYVSEKELLDFLVSMPYLVLLRENISQSNMDVKGYGCVVHFSAEKNYRG
jgi:hypothetical protein